MDSQRSIVSFLRKNGNDDDMLLVVCNFTPVTYEKFQIGVPFKGKYKEIFNSDAEEFGGEGVVNPRVKQSKKEEFDEREHSITITVPPLGISVFQCTPVLEAASEKTTETKTKESKSASSKASEKKDAEVKASEEKVAEKKLEEKKLEEKATEKKPEEKKASEEKATEKKSEDNKTAVKKTVENTVAEKEKTGTKKKVTKKSVRIVF